MRIEITDEAMFNCTVPQVEHAGQLRDRALGHLHSAAGYSGPLRVDDLVVVCNGRELAHRESLHALEGEIIVYSKRQWRRQQEQVNHPLPAQEQHGGSIETCPAGPHPKTASLLLCADSG